MTEVLKALQDLNVVWKKIGHYNMKCRWTPGIPCGDEGMVNNSMHGNHYFEDDSSIIENDDITRLSDVVKFEVQVGVMVNISSFQYNLTIMLLFKVVFALQLGCSFTRLVRTSICLTYRGSRVPNYSSWIFVLLFLLSFVCFEVSISSKVYESPRRGKLLYILSLFLVH